jgi:hypothetical protein
MRGSRLDGTDWRAPSVRIIFPKQLHANPWGAQRTARSSGEGLCRGSREESGSSQPPCLFPLHISIGANSPSHAATTPHAPTAGIGRRSDHHSRISCSSWFGVAGNYQTTWDLGRVNPWSGNSSPNFDLGCESAVRRGHSSVGHLPFW